MQRLGVLLGCALLMLTLSSVDCRLDGGIVGIVVTLLPQSDTSIKVFFYLFPTPPIMNINYTVYYDFNLDNPDSFTPSSPGAMSTGANTREATLAVPSAGTSVTVVVVAVNTTNITDMLMSVPQTVATYGGSVGVPGNVRVMREDNNKTLVINWDAVDTSSAYDVQYRIALQEKVTTHRVTGQTTRVPGVDENTNYEVRVRAVVEGTGSSTSVVMFNTGPFSPWVASQVKIDTGGLGGGAASVKMSLGLLTAITVLLFLIK